jgi:polyhydroxyalkanoate synthesis regulator phasin
MDLKDILHASSGAFMLAKEKIESELNELVEKGKMSKDEAKEFLEKAQAKGKDEEEKLMSKIKDSLKEIINEMGLATKDDLEKLKEELKK